MQALVCPLSAYERDNGKGRNGAHSAVRFLSSFTLRVKAGDCNHLCPDRVSGHRWRNSEASAASLNLTSCVKSIMVFTAYTATGFASLKCWLEYQLPPRAEKEILNEFSKQQQKMFKSVNFGDMIKMNYRIIITLFLKAPVWKHKCLSAALITFPDWRCWFSWQIPFCVLRNAFCEPFLSLFYPVSVFWIAPYFL